jgi:hypothetical protein
MRLNKKIIFFGLLVAAVLGGTLGGIAIAQTNDQPASLTDNTTQVSALLERVAEIYQQNTGVAIDAQELAKAIKEAQQETCNQALDKFLDRLAEKGILTQDQADQYKEWLDARPDVPIKPGLNFEFHNRLKMGGMFGRWGLNNNTGTTD